MVIHGHLALMLSERLTLLTIKNLNELIRNLHKNQVDEYVTIDLPNFHFNFKSVNSAGLTPLALSC